MLAMLASTTALWEAADPSTPVVPAIHYIAVVSQAGAGKVGLGDESVVSGAEKEGVVVQSENQRMG